MSNEQQKTNVLVIELINQQPSNFVLDGADEESDLPTNISAPNARKIKNRSKMKVTVQENGRTYEKLVPIRFIAGCDEILVSKQDEMGYKPNPAADTIWILNGKLTVVENQSDIGKYRYLKAFEGNVDNPDRPDNAIGVYKEIRTDVEAVETESFFDIEFKVQKYLNSLKKPIGDNKYEYNEDAIAFLCKLFKLPSFETGYRSEAWVALVMRAKDDPARFLKSITNLYALVESEVNQALSEGIIQADEEKFFFINTKMVILTTRPEQSNDERKQSLVEFLANPENSKYYNQLRSDLHNKKVDQAAILT